MILEFLELVKLLLDRKLDKELKIEGLLDVIRKRWSPRAFSNRTVEKEKIVLMFEAARWTASCYNEQPWRFIIEEKNGNSKYEEILSILAEFNQAWAKTAPLLIVAVSSDSFAQNGNPNTWSVYDSGQAVASMVLQAQYLGLYTHQMGGFDKEKIKILYEIPEGYNVHSVIAVGYIGKVDDLPEFLRELEGAERKRKEISEIAFNGDWKTPY